MPHKVHFALGKRPWLGLGSHEAHDALFCLSVAPSELTGAYHADCTSDAHWQWEAGGLEDWGRWLPLVNISKTVSHWIALVDLKLAIYTRMTLKGQRSAYLCL